MTLRSHAAQQPCIVQPQLLTPIQAKPDYCSCLCGQCASEVGAPNMQAAKTASTAGVQPCSLKSRPLRANGACSVPRRQRSLAAKAATEEKVRGTPAQGTQEARATTNPALCICWLEPGCWLPQSSHCQAASRRQRQPPLLPQVGPSCERPAAVTGRHRLCRSFTPAGRV